ncbi:FAD-dependent oxidoreductase [Marivibrio halodurans]|uniref:FAD-dependent oxidoreductase n=1 Tax=Marivibrio halodurans TaxID=2039722 RepID=A0A8J7SKP5_9PROT|nr:FAD-dependent oxidoreductase [Marivibrio halodurans]MBP5858608.1 FAD-dependent oxidoreductase [Marivibrio halodurans]
MTEASLKDGAVEDVAVAIVGGGPAGLAAATRLAEQGIRDLVLLEREEEAGGIPRHCGHYPFGLREMQRLLRGPDYARRLAARARAAGVDIRTRTSVVRLGPGPHPTLDLTTPEGATRLRAERVLLATGVRETSRAARLIGGGRMRGVVSTGALQSMIYLKGLVPFRRPVVLGTELVSFSSLMTCRHAGARPVAMVEPGTRITARSFARALPALMGIPVHLETTVEAIHGTDRVEGVTLAGPDGARREIDCDGVIVSGAFTPEASLARLGGFAIDAGGGGPVIDQYGRMSDPAYYAAGNLLRPVETAGWSWREGLTVADALAADLRGGPPPPPTIRLSVTGDALRFVTPSRLSLDGPAPAFDAVQLRAARAARGLLTARAGSRILWTGRLDTLPERRILAPIAPLLAAGPGAEITFALEEGRETS